MSVDCASQLGFHRPLSKAAHYCHGNKHLTQCPLTTLASLVKESIVVRNPNNRPVAFKVKTTAPKQYCVRPNSGRIEPGQEVEVHVVLQAMKEEPPMDHKCRDKFLFQSTIISAEHESSSIQVLWSAVEAKNRDDIHEKKIRCVFLPADGSVNNHNASHDTYDQTSSTPTYHAAETSTSDARNIDAAPLRNNDSNSSSLFRPEPALSSPRNLQVIEATNSTRTQDTTTSAGSPDLESQLREARAKIERLQKQVDGAVPHVKNTESQVTAHNEGVPVPITALIALIAFMAAYLLF